MSDSLAFLSEHRVPDEPMTATSAAHALVEEGFAADTASAMVRGYLDDVSREIGMSVHRWGIDHADLAAIIARHDTDHHDDVADSAVAGARVDLDDLADRVTQLRVAQLTGSDDSPPITHLHTDDMAGVDDGGWAQ